MPRILRFVTPLRTPIYSTMVTLQSLLWAMVLLLMIVYFAGVILTQAVNDHLVDVSMGARAADPSTEKLEMFWGSLGTSMFTLFKSISGGISWHDVCDPLKSLSFLWVTLFGAFIAFTYFAVLNVVTGVFCNSAIETAQSDPDPIVQSIHARRKHTTEKIKTVFGMLDTDISGYITILEFEKRLADVAVQAYFEGAAWDTWLDA